MELKVCGLKHQAKEVAALGADYLGFIFWEPSSRYYQGESLEDVSAKKVGVFVDAPIELVRELASHHQLNYIQLHGKESVEYCKTLAKAGYQLFKAFSVGASIDFNALSDYEPYCELFLFDTKGRLPGGNGDVFSWELLRAYPLETPYLLSGGISPSNINEAIKFASEQKLCRGLDVNSGYEISPGNKDLSELQKTIALVK